MLDPEGQQRQRRDLAETLRGLRKAAGLSGERLAARCALSQSKISRIERGKILPTVLDVQRILDALGVADEAAGPLLDMARTANVHYLSWRACAETGLWRKQEELKELAASAATIRYFHAAIPSGMLQTREYATAVLTPNVKGRAARDVARTVQARIGRQEMLRDESRSFLFVLTEQAIRWRCAPPEVMAGQCEHMAAVAEQENVVVAVIPGSAEVSEIPLNTFVLYDERFVIVELFSGEVILRDPRDVAHHLNLFQFFLGNAVVGVDAARLLRFIADEFMRDRD